MEVQKLWRSRSYGGREAMAGRRVASDPPSLKLWRAGEWQVTSKKRSSRNHGTSLKYLTF